MISIKEFLSNPLLVRVAPFFIFAALTSLQGILGEESKYWFYLIKCIVGAGMLWAVWPVVKEARWSFSWEGIVVGTVVGILWVGLDSFYPKLMTSTGKAWNPFAEFGSGSMLGWFFVLTRIFGSAIIVPPLEELFYRSFVYRYIIKADFHNVPLNIFNLRAFLIVSIVFGLVHREWLAGILCGAAYLGLVLRHNRLNEAMLAHAVTNFLLGVYVVWRGAWEFW